MTLTEEQVSQLQALLNNGDRGEFYWQLYQITGKSTLLTQASITTYSGVWGGLAVSGNYFAKLADNKNYDLALDTFSFAIAIATLGLFEDSPDISAISDEDILISDRGVWNSFGLRDLFPGNFLLLASELEFRDKYAALVAPTEAVVEGWFDPLFSSDFYPWELGKRYDDYDDVGYERLFEDGVYRVYDKITGKLVFVAEEASGSSSFITSLLNVSTLGEIQNSIVEAIPGSDPAYSAREALWEYTQANQPGGDKGLAFVPNQIPPNTFLSNRLDSGTSVDGNVAYHQTLLALLHPIDHDSQDSLTIFEREQIVRLFSNERGKGIESFVRSLAKYFSVEVGETLLTPEAYSDISATLAFDLLDAQLGDYGLLSLYDLSANDIATLAGEDSSVGRGVRYALVESLPFALTKNIAGTAADHADFEASNFTEEYLESRAEYVSILLLRNNENIASEPAVVETEDDRLLFLQDLGREEEFQTFSFAPSSELTAYLFGTSNSDAPDNFAGGESSDYIFGLEGDDHLRGLGGRDYLEGALAEISWRVGLALIDWSVKTETTHYLEGVAVPSLMNMTCFRAGQVLTNTSLMPRPMVLPTMS